MTADEGDTQARGNLKLTEGLDWCESSISFMRAAWNLYRGDLGVLRATRVYTQLPGSNTLASQECGLGQFFFQDVEIPEVGQTAFYLVTGVAGGIEGDLGADSTGAIRPNDNPCP